MMTSPAPLYSAFRFRIHTAAGTKTETQGETYALAELDRQGATS